MRKNPSLNSVHLASAGEEKINGFLCRTAKQMKKGMTEKCDHFLILRLFPAPGRKNRRR